MIYFITARDVGRVKIGYSHRPDSRITNLNTGSPVALTLERVCDGDFETERALHTRFAAHRHLGEWFVLSDEIEAHMATLPSPIRLVRPKSMNKILIEALGCSKGYASQVLSGKDGHKITIPIAVSVYRHCGLKIGPLETATDDEIDTLDKFCGRFAHSRKQAA